jgi:hypothetical protein
MNLDSLPLITIKFYRLLPKLKYALKFLFS